MNVERFAQCCLAKVCRGEDGHVRLTVCCVLRDPTTGKRRVHVKEVNLDPLLKWASHMFAQYHHRLHSLQDEPPTEAHIAGDWDDIVKKSVAVARRIGESRLVMALYSEVSPMLSQGNGEDSDMHRQAHEVLLRAMHGDQKSLAIMNALMSSAYRGNTRALEIMTLMRDMHLAMEGKEAVNVAGLSCVGVSTPDLVLVGSWWKKLKRGLKKVAKVATAPVWAPALMTYKMAKGDFRGALDTAKGAVGDTLSLTKDVAKIATAPVWAPAYLAYKGGQAVANAVMPGGDDGGGQPTPDQLPPPQDAPTPTPTDQPPMPTDQPPMDMGPVPDDSGPAPDTAAPPDDGDGSGDDGSDVGDDDAQVAGWFYNKGFRTVPEVVTAKFPGLGLTLREMYHRGSDSSQSVAVAPIQPVAATTVDDLAASGAAANSGNAQASPTVVSSGTYVVGLSWHSLMRKAHNLAHTVSTATHAIIRSDVYKNLSPLIRQVAPLVAKAIPYGGVALEAANQIHDIIQKAKADHPEALQAIAAIRQWANNGDEKAMEVAHVMKNMSDTIDAKAAAAPPVAMVVRRPGPAMYRPGYQQMYYRRSAVPMAEVRDGTGYYRRGMGHQWLNRHLRHLHMQPQVGGWLYNKPYRSVLEAPGMGVTMRELYNRGEGRSPTTLTDVLRQVFPLGTGTQG